MEMDWHAGERRHQDEQQARNGDHNRHAPMSSKTSKPVFFLAFLLLGVIMSVSNIRNAVRILPDSIENDILGIIMTPIDEVPVKKRPLLSNGSDNRTVADHAVPLDRATPELSMTLSESQSLLLETPGDKNTVISIVAMGRLVNGYLVERCIRSIRRRGLFNGNILVFTDQIGHDRYQTSVLSWDNRTKIIVGRDEDMHPTDPITETPIRYTQGTMIFKRFKTHHSKYIADDADLRDSVRYVMYLDVDNLVGAPLSHFFRAYADGVASEYRRASDVQQKWKQNTTLSAENAKDEKIIADVDLNHDDFGFVSMFPDAHLKRKMHSGIIVFDRKFEERCVNGWRNEIDTFKDSSDQTLFVRVLENYDRYRCVAFKLPGQYMSFAAKRIMVGAMEARQKNRKKRKPLVLPTFIHVTNFRVKRIRNDTIHDDFIRYVLDLKDNENISDGISWEDVVPFNAERTVIDG
mmetsp:Transcript_12783/g.36090  ORF Transcript_12783/g.36090 Transcript_12783/m.36090 type:complete len:463 (+) Transcript_12783:177-1565(+)